MQNQRNFTEIVAYLKSWLLRTSDGAKGRWNKDVAILLSLSEGNLATHIGRNSVPYSKILLFCSSNGILSDEIFFKNNKEEIC